METEDNSKPGKMVLFALGGIMLLSGVLVAAELTVPLQPSGSGPVNVQGQTVVMQLGVGSNTQLNYVPRNLTVIVGQNDTVKFVNQDTAPHTVTATDNSFDSGNMDKGATWSHTFSTPGVYTYYCKYHFWMQGKIVVKAPSASP